MSHPGDAADLFVAPGEAGTQQSCWRLFGSFLEKGVIRRARLRADLLPREHDVAMATRCLAAFRDSAIPLTT
jgi:hypothetical protein